MVSFNEDGSLAVSQTQKKKKDHLMLLKAIDEVPFGMGRKLLVAYMQGKQNAQSTRLRLDRYLSFGELGGFIDEEINTLITHLEQEEFITTNKEKGLYTIFVLTEKGKDELEIPQHTICINDIDKKILAEQSQEVQRLKIKNTFPPTSPATEQEQALFQALNDFFPHFNERQRKAVISSNKHIICVAGAGSGKTSVLTKRIEFLIKYKSANPKKILAITFTRKARLEMKERLQKSMPETPITIETFNSFCEKTLQKNAYELYGTQVDMIQMREQITFLIEALKKNGYTQNSMVRSYFTSRQQQGKDAKSLFFSFRYDFQSLIDKIRLTKTSMDELRASIKKNTEHTQLAENLLNIAQDYLKLLKEHDKRDFTDQLIDTITLFKKKKQLIPEFEHILVDEYQDVNDQQIDLLRLLNSVNLFAVGDPRQSIYGWRGSKMQHIIDFPNIHPAAQVIQLTKNYRSNKNIVALCNAIINKTGYEDLESASEEEGIVELNYYKTEDNQALAIVNDIVLYEGNRKNIFVLSRTNKALEKIKEACEAKGIDYLLRTDELRRPGIEAQNGQVTLATVHAIKGLEAERVYLISANGANFPCKATDHPVMDLYHMQEDYDSYAEELRVLYVALSRPQKELYISYTANLSPFFTEDIVQLMKKTSSVSAQQIKGKKKSSASSSPSTAKGEATMMRLRAWRYKKAKERGCPAYVICSDATLRAVIEQEPTSPEDLFAIKGLGPARVEEFGDELILELLK